MNYRPLFLLFALILSAITFVVLAAWRRPARLLVLLTAFSLTASAQNWSPFLDSSRATNWASAGFTIPNYTTNCLVQPTLVPNSSVAAAANSTTIQLALASCDATHNVVNIPAGTYYVAGITYPDHGNQVVRGAGANSTTLNFTSDVGCNGENSGICMYHSASIYAGNGAALSGGSQQCSWTAGYAKGSTTLTFSSCGSAPPLNSLIVLDQANDSSDTNGVYICDSSASTCTYNGSSSDNHNGRVISGVPHSQQQVVRVTNVSGSGSGPYTVTVSPGVYFTNIRSSQSPGAWWSASTQHDGVENLKVDGTHLGLYTIAMYSCDQCWVKGVTSVYGPRAHVVTYLSLQDVIRDSYFYQAQTVGSDSYGIESEESSAFLVENNIFQQTTAPIMFGQGSGAVVGYNFSIDNQFVNNFLNPMYASHNAGNEMNLFEGNNTQGIWSDDAWGSSDQKTDFRNMLIGWAATRINSTFPVMERSFNRNINYVGNILGQPGYHNSYQSYATSSSGGVNQGLENTSIFSFGWGNTGADCTGVPICDTKVFTTSMRWGNYDTVNAAVRWDSTEASPAANTYVAANFSSSYFGGLAHTLPASLYYSSAPSWWPSGKNWPPIGPDISTGNVGICTGSYAGSQATSSSQCAGGTLSAAWASHVTSIPAQDCFLSVMGGRPDGSGGELNFNANSCYSSSAVAGGTGPQSPTGLVATVN